MSELIRIGMPVFNGETHLGEAFESLLNQTYENFEIFMIDNASTDRTQDIARSYATKDSRIKYFRQPEWVSATANWNRTYELAARGVRFFMWASDDDLWARDYIESLLPSLIQNPKVVLSFSQADQIDAEGRTIGELYRKSFPGGTTPFGRVRSIIRDGRYAAIYGLIRTDAVRWVPCLSDTSFGSDLWFLIRLATTGDFSMIKRPLFFKRKGGICETGMDPSASHDPFKMWNIEDQECKLISQLDLSWLAKIYTFFRLKVSAKILYPKDKKISPLLLPAVYFLMLRENPYSLGVRCRLKSHLLRLREKPQSWIKWLGDFR